LEYGNLGEAGYRVGVVWDADNDVGSPVEVINTYVINLNDPTEAYDDTLYQANSVTLEQIVGVEGFGRETISKVSAYSLNALIAHQDEPKVFSDVTVRNDQHINLFAGELDSVDNSLNETTQRIRADLDSPKKFALQLPPINAVNPIQLKNTPDAPLESASPDDVSSSAFKRDVQPFESGELKWVQVKIPLQDLEEFGEDVRLVDPTKFYPSAEDAAEFKIDEDIGENEVEKLSPDIGIESSKTTKIEMMNCSFII
jgi:hypothetical protein